MTAVCIAAWGLGLTVGVLFLLAWLGLTEHRPHITRRPTHRPGDKNIKRKGE